MRHAATPLERLQHRRHTQVLAPAALRRFGSLAALGLPNNHRSRCKPHRSATLPRPASFGPRPIVGPTDRPRPSLRRSTFLHPDSRYVRPSFTTGNDSLTFRRFFGVRLTHDSMFRTKHWCALQPQPDRRKQRAVHHTTLCPLLAALLSAVEWLFQRRRRQGQRFVRPRRAGAGERLSGGDPRLVRRFAERRRNGLGHLSRVKSLKIPPTARRLQKRSLWPGDERETRPKVEDCG